jgi:hypothetical protein
MGNGIVARGCRTIGIDSCVTDRMLKVIGGKTGLALIESFSLDSDATFENGKIFGDMKKKKRSFNSLTLHRPNGKYLYIWATR